MKFTHLSNLPLPLYEMRTCLHAHVLLYGQLLLGFLWFLGFLLALLERRQDLDARSRHVRLEFLQERRALPAPSGGRRLEHRLLQYRVAAHIYVQ